MSRTHLWQRIYLHCFVFAIAFFLIAADDETGQLTLCGQQSEDLRSLVFVSTLDGKISALDASKHGQKQWSLDFNGESMLSSNIHSKELNNNGQWVRLIPSLSGRLYKFDGEHLETMPVSVDQLLHSSFRYSDDLVFSGGKEIHSYGVLINTGKILYECTVNGCMNNTKERHLEQEVLVIKRFQQTVRAIEPRTGIERWNFSVGQHNMLQVLSTNDVYCSNKIATLDIEIKVVIPQGLIWAVSKSNPTVKLWQYKFDAPIVSIWRENATSASQGSLEEINLFDSSQWIWGSEYLTVNPSLYIGMHEKQLYVQENFKFKHSLDSSSKYIQRMKYPWQPHPAVGAAVVNTVLDQDNNDETAIETNIAPSTTAFSVLYNTEYVNGNGFYLYSSDQLSDNKQCNRNKPDILLITNMEKPMLTYIEEEEEDDTPVQVIIVSLWYWWKEVLIISITTAILLNFVLTQRLLKSTTVSKDTLLSFAVETKRSESNNTDNSENMNNFKSRYLTDFEPVDCLGKGGYGVVFEAKNKIDDCNYAIKRIALPNSQDSRERVMREVKALAKLDHHNIVRYFNAWLECPPHGWQEEHDHQWISKLKFSSSEFPLEVTQTETKPNNSVYIDVSQTDPSSIDSLRKASELNKVSANDDSFIVFENSNGKQHDDDAVCINGCDIDSSDMPFSNNGITDGMSSNIGDATDHSENIIFEKTSNVDTSEKKKKLKLWKSTFSLDLDNESKIYLENESNVCKSAKMFLYIQMQLCQRLSLREWLKEQSSTRDPLRALNIFQQIVDAVEYVHLQGLIHRDLKPSNIFFAYDDKIKVGDFGLVTAMIERCDGTHTPAPENESVTLNDSVHTACVGTHLYMSPEQMNGQIYNYKVDIYSLGIIFFELLIPFFTDMERVMTLSNLRKSSFPKDFAENYPAEYNLLKMMLDENPTKRPTTLGVKARPPLQKYDIANGFNSNEHSKWHFELPQLTRHSSVTGSSSSSFES